MNTVNMRVASVGWYDNRNKCAVWVNKGTVQAVMGEKATGVRVEALEDVIVLTHPHKLPFRGNQEDYLE